MAVGTEVGLAVGFGSGSDKKREKQCKQTD